MVWKIELRRLHAWQLAPKCYLLFLLCLVQLPFISFQPCIPCFGFQSPAHATVPFSLPNKSDNKAWPELKIFYICLNASIYLPSQYMLYISKLTLVWMCEKKITEIFLICMSILCWPGKILHRNARLLYVHWQALRYFMVACQIVH